MSYNVVRLKYEVGMSIVYCIVYEIEEDNNGLKYSKK